MPTILLARAAAVLVALEAIGVLAVAVWQVVAVAGGDTDSAVSSIALLVLTLVGAVAVAAFAVGIWRGWSWGRSGGIVTQLLIIAVAVGALTGAGADPLLAIGLIVPAVAVFVLLILVIRRTGAQKSEDDESRRN